MNQTSDQSVDWGKWVGGAVAGALLMYMLDPERGGQRRAASGQTLRSLSRQTGSVLGSVAREAGTSVGGTVANLGSKLSSAAGELVQHAGELMPQAANLVSQAREAVGPDGVVGRMASTGMRSSGIRSGTASDVTATASDMLHSATDGAGQLMHSASDGAGQLMHSASGGAGQLMHSASESAGQLMRSARQAAQGASQQLRGDWAPGMRGAAMLGGGALGLYGLMRRSPMSMMLGVAGLTLLARGATNLPLRRMMTGAALTQPIDVEQSIHIDASPEQVYDLWTNYENFPQFMSHVVEVRDLGGRRSHWVVKGPGGSEFSWDAVTTEKSRPNRLAWRSEPGAEIAQSGSIQFESYRGGTRVTVRMSYTPPAGVLGHGIATLLGADPQRQMQDDLTRMKDFIERGQVPRNGTRHASIWSRFLH
jgi:uncharacterized membrane protein